MTLVVKGHTVIIATILATVWHNNNNGTLNNSVANGANALVD